MRTLPAGASFEDSLEAVNLTGAPLDLRIHPVDATITANGGFAPGFTRSAEGAWITVAQERLQLGPRGRARVGVRVQVPPDAAPGDHIAAVVVERATPRDGAGNVTLVERVGVRVYLTVPGAGGPGPRSFELRALRWVGTPKARAFEAEVANTGRLLVEPVGSLTISRGDLSTTADVPVLGTVPPTTTRNLRVALPGDLEPGRYQVRLSLRPVQGGPSQERAVDFIVGANDLEGRRGLPSWLAVLGVALAVVVLLAAVSAWRRS